MQSNSYSRRLAQLATFGAILLAAPAVAGAQSSCSCMGDLTGDGIVDGADLGRLLGAWGTGAGAADLNQSGLVDGADLGLLLGAWGPCGAPANDLCGGAQFVGPGEYAFCTAMAGTDGPTLPANSCGYAGQVYNDVWFVYEALSDGQLALSTCNNADFDSVIAVYGSALPGFSPCPTEGIGLATLTGCNDDSAGCGGLTSAVTVNVAAGHLYRIRVGGFNPAESGTGYLLVDFTQPGESCENHRNAANVHGIQTIIGDTRDNQISSYPDNCALDHPYGPTEWIRWESTCSGTVTFSTCNAGTDFDTVLTVLRYEYNGFCWGSYVTCVDDSTGPGCGLDGYLLKSRVQHNTFGGEVLYILVAGYNGGAGKYELTIDLDCN